MQSDSVKSDGANSDLRIRWPKSSGYGPKSDDSAHRILKSKKGIGLESSILPRFCKRRKIIVPVYLVPG